MTLPLLPNDRVFGFGPMLDWDLFQLLGIENKPPGSMWTLSTDYFNLRPANPTIGPAEDWLSRQESRY